MPTAVITFAVMSEERREDMVRHLALPTRAGFPSSPAPGLGSEVLYETLDSFFDALPPYPPSLENRRPPFFEGWRREAIP